MKLNTFIQKEGKIYVAVCPELDIMVQAETPELALMNLEVLLSQVLEEGFEQPFFEMIREAS